MKKISVLLVSALLIAMLSACVNTNEEPTLSPAASPAPEALLTEEPMASPTDSAAIPPTDVPTDLPAASSPEPSADPTASAYPIEAPEDMIPLGEDTEKQIKQTYYDLFLKKELSEEATPDDVMLRYYGTYGGAVAVMLTDRFSSYTMAEWSETIQNITIYYSDGRYITVWKDGVFYRLQEAYDRGILTVENIAQIAAIQNENKVFDR